MNQGHEYNEDFYRYTNTGALSSAEVVIPVTLHYVRAQSVADFGCGQGAWLAVWQKYGANEIMGVDGAYVDQTRLLIDRKYFVAHDLTMPLVPNRKFDLVQSIEVAEHLPEAVADQFIETLAAHGDVILFSAAPPGQGGEYHINERPYEYWREKFSRRGYELLDVIRDRIKDNPEVEVWYRYNTFLYVKRELLEGQLRSLRQFVHPIEAPILDKSPLPYRIRKGVVRLLPSALTNAIARWRASVVGASRK